MSDYHLHLHPHAYEAPVAPHYDVDLIERYVEHAAKRGVTELGFTEHLYRCVEARDVLGYFWKDEPEHVRLANQRMMDLDVTLSLEAYVEVVLAAKERGLPVKLGLEVDFFPDTIEAVMQFLEPYPFDHLIGSVHWLGGLGVDTPWGLDEMVARGLETSWTQYLGVLEQLAGSGVVDVLAHADVVKKYGTRLSPEPIGLYKRVAAAAAASGTAVEVSSGGLRHPIGEEYPSPAFLEVFREYGVPITLASDAHADYEAGWGHDGVVTAARNAGYTSYLRFEAGESYEVPLS